MTNKKLNEANAVSEALVTKLAKSAIYTEVLQKTDNPWTEITRFKAATSDKIEYGKSVDHCRFFYRTEPLVSTVIDKLVEIGINDLAISKNKLSENEFRLFTAIKPRLVEFAEQMALEYLLSGFVIPEIGYTKADKDFAFSLGVKKLNSVVIPDSMWVRDPKTIRIDVSLLNDMPAYFIQIPQDVLQFVKTKGTFASGKKDPELYQKMVEEFPDFIALIEKGDVEVLLENDMVFRRKYMSDNPYPIPYVNSALEALYHKRKMRRMDYSIMDKVISAIMHVKVGDKDFPITDSDEDQEYLSDLGTQLNMRGSGTQVLERIFQLITNHTVDISWIFPDTQALLNVDKYNDINQEILFGLGFPRVLITGEALRSGSTDPEIATLSPIKTAEDFRRKILNVLQEIVLQVSQRNGFKSVPQVSFREINLKKFKDFLDGLKTLYEVAGISRTSFARELGFDFTEEVDNMKAEQDALIKRGLPEFGPTPNSKNPNLPVDNTNQPANPTNNTQNQQQNNQNQNQQNPPTNNQQTTNQGKNTQNQ